MDVSANAILYSLRCSNNSQIDSLDVSSNPVLVILHCSDNQLSYLDIRNGNNTNMNMVSYSLYTQNNPNLFCIAVDDSTWATANWTVANGNIDPQHSFGTNCTPSWDCIAGACVDYNLGTGVYTTLSDCQTTCGVSAIEENSTTKQLLKITDVLGRESKPTPNVPLFYRYDDGTVEKKLIIE